MYERNKHTLYITGEDENNYYVKHELTAKEPFTIQKKDIEDHPEDYYIYRDKNQFMMIKKTQWCIVQNVGGNYKW